AAPAAAAASSTKHDATAAAPEQRITVETDVLAVTLSTLGGDVRHVELLGYPFAKAHPEQNVALLDDGAERWFVIQSGLMSSDGALVSNKDAYRATQTRYVLASGADQIEVPLEFADGQ